jgi:hypothetical protein
VIVDERGATAGNSPSSPPHSHRRYCCALALPAPSVPASAAADPRAVQTVLKERRDEFLAELQHQQVSGVMRMKLRCKRPSNFHTGSYLAQPSRRFSVSTV